MAGAAPEKRRTTLQILSYISLIYAALAWGSTFVMVKSVAVETGPLLLVAYRFGIAGAAMALFLLAKGRPLTLHWRHGLKLGALLAFMYITQTTGLMYTSAANSGFITGLFVAFLPLFIFLSYKELPTARNLLVVALSVAGLWFLTGGVSGANYGDFLTVLAAIAYAAYIPLTDRALQEGADPFTMLAQSFLLTGAVAFLGALALGESVSAVGAHIWSTILFLAFVPSLSAYLAQFFAQRHVAPLAVGMTFLLEPVFATIFAVSWGGEILSIAQMFGGAVILVAMALSLDTKRTPSKATVKLPIRR